MNTPQVIVLDKMEDMGNRLKKLRVAADLTQKALGDLVGTSKGQIAKLEDGDRRLSDHWAQRLAPHLGVQPYELFMPEGIQQPLRFVPLVGHIACGNWQEAVSEPEGSVPAMTGGVNVFALRASGESMNKLIEPNGYVYVDPDDRDLIDGKAYAVMNGGGETTAKVFRANPARLVPCSTDPEFRETIIGSDQFTVVGRIVGTYSPL